MQGARDLCLLPFDGITRIRFNGYNLNPDYCRVPPQIAVQIYYFFFSFIS